MGKPIKNQTVSHQFPLYLLCRNMEFPILTLLVVTTSDLKDVTLEFVTEGVTGNLRTISPISHSILALLIETSVYICA